MSENQKKPGVAFWATVVVVVALVGYPLSFGPACWISSRTGIELSQAYFPIGWLLRRSPQPLANALGMYAWYGMKEGTAIFVPDGDDWSPILFVR